ncbi:ATP/GTP-binding protein [Archaeoglobus neptunius]|uniref:ATP/GTP-binding protein n=1 Tax=Archaeoglobus neptunius TaxID=2798580 RepID=UPI0019280040|nr:ATP/GTP-binding protein [Archaeoglobus neptunius]
MEIFVIGSAGSGKSTFVRCFSDFLTEKGYDVRCVNIDPASEAIYTASADIRKYIRTEEVMREYGLGINGALLKSIELGVRFAGSLKVKGDYVLYDTPGQMELFLYSAEGREFVEKLSGRFSAAVFLMDITLLGDAESLISAILQNVIVSLRLSLPTITAFTKVDIRDVDVEGLIEDVYSKEGVLAELLEKVVGFVEYTTIPYRPIKISNIKKTGYEDLFSALNELFCSCGDIS